jgi:haloacetate dehalogenase
MPDVAAGGVRFRLDRHGTSGGTAALLLHGVPQTARMWRHLAPVLATDRLVLTPDLKGLGGSEVRGPYDVATLVGELAALVLHEVDGPVDVVGHDWGGSLAIALAGTRPDLVRRLVAVNAPYREIDLRRAFHIPFFALPRAPEALFALGGADVIRRMIGYGWRAPQRLEPEVLRHYTAAYADPARVRAMLGYYRASARDRLRGARPWVSRPRAERALVLWGVEDPVLPAALGERVASDLGAAFVGFDGIGHFAPEEAPARVAHEVTQFLAAA